MKRLSILTDGKPGHENQSMALAEALQRRCACEIEIRPYKEWRTLSNPDLVISAGHKTHLPLLRAKWKYAAQSAVLMRPSLPAFCFDYIIAPEHDFPHGEPNQQTLLTQGMLCRLPEELTEKQGQSMILIGGPSKHYGWDTSDMLNQIHEAISKSPHPVILTDSRRTPLDTRSQLATIPNIQYYPWEDTERGWLPSQLAVSDTVWVSCDSMSMIYESLTSGAEVGLLSVPVAQQPTRITQSVDALIRDQKVRTLTSSHFSPPNHFHEAARIADVLLKKLSW